MPLARNLHGVWPTDRPRRCPHARARSTVLVWGDVIVSVAVSIDISPTFSRVPKISYVINLLNYMKLDFPRYTERLGAVSIHAVQRIYELDSGKSKGFQSSHQTVRKFDYDEISNI